MAIKIIRSLILLHCGRVCGKGRDFIVWWHFWNQLENLPCLSLIAALINFKPQQNQIHPHVLWSTQNTELVPSFETLDTICDSFCFTFDQGELFGKYRKLKQEVHSNLIILTLKWCLRPNYNLTSALTPNYKRRNRLGLNTHFICNGQFGNYGVNVTACEFV